ncbi:hypothetical protein P7K49_035523 [Saguinus oedipus]|uniref:Uncharacterized protein n=1 Tax=Saguinus oedipus TaxID=9490 RepID=A0ABQ9TMY8_SAGOE|nr:hypothetical protein P7K49_035523 [Saguinus oedipus]
MWQFLQPLGSSPRRNHVGFSYSMGPGLHVFHVVRSLSGFTPQDGQVDTDGVSSNVLFSGTDGRLFETKERPSARPGNLTLYLTEAHTGGELETRRRTRLPDQCLHCSPATGPAPARAPPVLQAQEDIWAFCLLGVCLVNKDGSQNTHGGLPLLASYRCGPIREHRTIIRDGWSARSHDVFHLVILFPAVPFIEVTGQSESPHQALRAPGPEAPPSSLPSPCPEV